MENKKAKVSKPTTNLFALGLLTMFIFIILKLAHIIPWHWVWITAPFWMSIVLVMFISLVKSIVNDIKIWNKQRKSKDE